MNNPQSETEVREAMRKWTEALHNKDLEAMHENYAEHYRLYDVMSTANSAAESKQLWTQCLPYFDQPQIERKNLVIEATEDMAFVHFRTRIKGAVTPPPDDMANAWLRGTCCFRKIDGIWKVVHEHISFPVDCMENKIIFETL